MASPPVTVGSPPAVVEFLFSEANITIPSLCITTSPASPAGGGLHYSRRGASQRRPCFPSSGAIEATRRPSPSPHVLASRQGSSRREEGWPGGRGEKEASTLSSVEEALTGEEGDVGLTISFIFYLTDMWASHVF